MSGRLTIVRAELNATLVDIDIADGIIERIAPHGGARPARTEQFDANGGAVLPGLHDHHLHLLAMAAAARSVQAGPPHVVNAAQLATALRRASTSLAPDEWIRAVGYHAVVAGDIDAAWLDQLDIARPIRVQHRSGALWILNSLALRAVGLGDHPTGRLYRMDDWLRSRVPRQTLNLAAIGDQLVSYGITGVTDLTPSTVAEELGALAAAVSAGHLPLKVIITGAASLPASAEPTVPRGPAKIVIDDHHLPTLEWVFEQFRLARSTLRTVAVHCVTREALVLALVAWHEVGALSGDRIEHGAIIPRELFSEIAALGLTVVTQPSFVYERGDQYLVDVEALDQQDLWRCRSLLEAGIGVAFGSDAPYGSADPWTMIGNAMHRRTANGTRLGVSETVEGETALRQLLGSAEQPCIPRSIKIGAPADLCILDRVLDEQLSYPTSDAVVATIVAGHIVFEDKERKFAR